MFDTYGPFTLRMHDIGSIDALFQEIATDPTADIEHGKGVYIVAASNADGVVVPWYVGRTFRQFGSRLKEHFEGYRFVELAGYGEVMFFFLALVRNGVIVQRRPNENQKHAIRYLELLLIGTSLKLNPQLLNKQQKRFHQDLHVAGYIDNGPAERDFPAAQALSKLLKT